MQHILLPNPLINCDPPQATCSRGFRRLSHAINMSVFCFCSTACCKDMPVVRVRLCLGEPQICKLTASRLMFFGGSCSRRFACPVSPYGGKTCRLRGAARADSAGRRRLFCSVHIGGWNVASVIDCVVAQVCWDFARGQGLYHIIIAQRQIPVCVSVSLARSCNRIACYVREFI